MEEYLSIYIRNSVFDKARIEKDRIFTTKKDKFFHGFGLENIKEIVEKYNEHINYEQKETILLFLIIIEFILNTKGYSIYKDILYENNRSSINITFWMGVRICLISPFIEETVFRGLILRLLKKYGVKFAIITQGLIFGVLHNNIITIVHATVFGILYGYIAAKTNSIVVTTILHIMQNSFTVLMGMTILKNVANIDLAQIVMAIIYLIVAIITLYRSNWKIRIGNEINIDVRKIFNRI